MGKVPTNELEKYDWPHITRSLTAFAKRRLGTRGTIEDAEEIAQEALQQFLDPEYAEWDRERPLLLHLGSVVNGILIDRMRKRKTRLDRHDGYCDLLILMRSGEALTPEEQGALREEVRRVMDLMLGRVSGDTVAEKVLFLQIEGAEGAREQAIRLNLPIADIRNARRRLAAHREAVDKLLTAEVPNAQAAQ